MLHWSLSVLDRCKSVRSLCIGLHIMLRFSCWSVALRVKLLIVLLAVNVFFILYYFSDLSLSLVVLAYGRWAFALKFASICLSVLGFVGMFVCLILYLEYPIWGNAYVQIFVSGSCHYCSFCNPVTTLFMFAVGSVVLWFWVQLAFPMILLLIDIVVYAIALKVIQYCE